MKNLLILFTITIAALITACNAQSVKNQDKTNQNSGKIEVYYFHFTSRCVTCLAVENAAKEVVEKDYSQWLENGKISFEAMNLDEGNAKKLAESIGVAGQTLLIKKGDKTINITNEAFMYARSNPEKFKAIMKEKIDGLVN